MRSVVGDGVSDAPETRARYAIGTATPGVVAEPADREALRACVAAIDAAGAALVPLGYGAHRDLGHAPRRYDVALITGALAEVVEYTPADMTITVGAGLTVSALQALLAREGQWLPVEPPCPDTTTVGGLVTADLGGRVRDFVIGIGAVMADGRAVRGGGRVVKNVAGYDLMKLLTGSLGTLAVVTDVTFKVRPQPAIRRVCVLEPADLAAALALVGTIGATTPDGMQTTLIVDAGRPRLVIRLHGVEADVAEMRAWLDAQRGAATVVLEAAEDDARATAVLEPVRDAVRATPADVVAQLASLPADAVLLAEAVGVGATRLQLDVAAGRVVVAATTGEPAQVIERWASAAEAHRAHLIVERWPVTLEDDVDVWRPLPAALPLMRRLKDELDPRGTLAPGRFVGRL